MKALLLKIADYIYKKYDCTKTDKDKIFRFYDKYFKTKTVTYKHELGYRAILEIKAEQI